MGRVTVNQAMRKRNLSLDPYDTKRVVQSYETLTAQGSNGFIHQNKFFQVGDTRDCDWSHQTDLRINVSQPSTIE